MRSHIALIRRSDRRRVAWNNGAGTTEVIAAGDGDPPTWRISVADLGAARSTFSAFPGVRRVFTVIGSNGVTLEWVSRAVDLEMLDPHAFDGESAPDCVPAGPTSAFNVMVRQDAATASVWTSSIDGSSIHTDPQAITVVYVHSGQVEASGDVAGSGDCIVVTRDSVTIDCTATIVVTEIRIAPPSMEGETPP